MSNLGVCKVYPELGPTENTDGCYSFQVLDIRTSNISCGNCCNWVAVDSITMNDVVMMLFSAGNKVWGACDRLPFEDCYGCSGCDTDRYPDMCKE